MSREIRRRILAIEEAHAMDGRPRYEVSSAPSGEEERDEPMTEAEWIEEFCMSPGENGTGTI